MELQTVKISKLRPNTGQIEGLPKNPRFIRDEKYAKLKKSIQDDPEMLELREVIAYDNGGELVVICGNMRLRALSDLGYTETPVKILPQETSAEKLRAYTIKDNLPYGSDDWDVLANEWDSEELSDWGVDIPGFDVVPEAWKEPHGKLSDKFIVPPFSVLDTKQGYWQDRKKQWLNIGIKSEIGREDNQSSLASAYKVKVSDSKMQKLLPIDVTEIPAWAVNSIFDPVLCEVAYRWFNVVGGGYFRPVRGWICPWNSGI